jgi:uncharacterized membrane protein YjgN (DUF898 family)
MKKSYFTAGLASYIWLQLTNLIIIVCSFGILYPWAYVRSMQWEIENLVIEGKYLIFTGTAVGLFGHWIKWFLLTLLTFGIYGFWIGIKLRQWSASHTHFSK